MKVKKENAFVGVDMAIAIIAIFVFSGLIITLMHSNFLENLKIKTEALAIIYLTETLENVAIADYDYITENDIETCIPDELKETNYQIKLEISDLELSEDKNEDIIKKVIATISYTLGEKNYEYSMERMKIKE